jgi:hemerythrin-like domain-containing protein
MAVWCMRREAAVAEQVEGSGQAAANDANMALTVQRQEHREHLRSILGELNRMANEDEGAEVVDIDGMSYEELQALGETIGRVHVCSTSFSLCSTGK